MYGYIICSLIGRDVDVENTWGMGRGKESGCYRKPSKHQGGVTAF